MLLFALSGFVCVASCDGITFHLLLGRQFGVKRELEEYGADVHGIRQMIIYGLKGLGSYARHARLLGEWDDSIGAFTSEVFVIRSDASLTRIIIMVIVT